MDSLGHCDDTDIQAILGRDEDFVGMENDVLPDFAQLEHFINSENDEQNDYFADTLANQEASRHNESIVPPGTVSSCDIVADSLDLITAHRSLSNAARIGTLANFTNQNHHQQPCRSRISETLRTRALGRQYSPGVGAPIPCGNYNMTHGISGMPESPPDSASEPPYSPPETNRSCSSIGSSPLDDHGTSQRYAFPADNYESIFGGIDLKSESVNSRQPQQPHIGYGVSNPSLQPNALHSILSPAVQSTPPNSAGSSLPISLNVRSCLNPNVTPTIYTIEDHAANSPLINLASSSGAPEENSGSENDISPSSRTVQQKKRKLSVTECFPIGGGNPIGATTTSPRVKQEPQHSITGQGMSPRQISATGTDEDYSYEFSADSSMFNDSYQCIRFQAFQQNSWHSLFDGNFKELPLPSYRIDADKGFNFSNTDEAFVCQKKNHFQITCHVQQAGEPYYVKTSEGLKKVDNFFLHFFGAKAEAPTQMIRVEQSQSDRSKKPFHPVLLELQQDQVSKITVGRLHFNETTANNMRKKGKPNPDQRFFNLVVSLQAHCGDTTFCVIAHSSERIIVRASNPGMFENEVEQNWQRGTFSDSIFHAGRVGINTDRPDEALVIHGNLKITGHLVQPSDRRAKEGIEEADTKEQLRNVQALRVVHYKYTEEFAETAGLKEDERGDTGVIAQEVESIIPDAVRPAGNIVLPNGRQIENFLVVNKERIFMENVGAVKELCKVTDNLETRIDELERMNHKLAKLKRLDSIRSSASGSTASNLTLSVGRHRKHCKMTPSEGNPICANRVIQATVIILVMIMALCLVAMATLYILEWQKRNTDNLIASTNGQQTNSEFHTVLNYTDPSMDYVYLPDSDPTSLADNKNFKPPDVATTLSTSNSTTISVISSSRSIPLPTKQDSLASNLSSSSRFYTSLTSSKPNAVGQPDSCTTTTSCQVYCCAGNELVMTTTHIPTSTSTTRRDFQNENTSTERALDTSGIYEVSSRSPTEDELGNNVEHFNNKEGKNRPFGGPSDLATGLLRDINRQFNLQKQRDKKTVRVPRQKRHLLIQNRELGYRGPADAEFTLGRTHIPSIKPTSTQATTWDGRVTYIRLVGSNFNVTLGPNYCMPNSDEYIRCLNGDAVNYTYGIPLSKHMPDRSLTLQFHFTNSISFQPDQCTSPVRLGACPDGQRDTMGANSIQRGPTLNHVDSVARTFFIDVGRSSIVAYRFRFPVLRGDTVDLCSKPNTSLGEKYVEYNLVFYRVCGD
ncbi:myelin regulatory factor-like isoform X2 [Daphnia pulicaria]|uniref:myelin regulatory factor-like isoform X2 n=1 Tax=Daphnia pulicaria TaxID=35523 RepID=UPI001EE9D254|nr:myelin regulatory factor-like isoform X2 [Daphnia pulicaria]